MSGADNQQERPGFEQWIVGFVDGEGCFSVPIFRQRTARLGWQCQPEFAVVQAAPSALVLHELQQYFDCGRVGVNRRHDNHRSDMYRWSVRSLDDLTCRILPFFERYPLRTAKAQEFDRFAAVVRMMRRGEHLTVQGLDADCDDSRYHEPSESLLDSWNPQRPYASHLETTYRGEEMVLAPWRHGEC